MSEAKCRHCGQVEGSEWLLQINHGWRADADHCLSMHLRRNHVIAMTRGATTPEQIEEYVDRALAAWGDRLDADILAAARARIEQLRGRAAPGHSDVHETEEVALW